MLRMFGVVLLLACSSCVIHTIDPIVRSTYEPVVEHYRALVEKEAASELKCKNLKIEVAEKAFLMRQFKETFLVTDLGDVDTREKLKDSAVPVVYDVSGCEKQMKYVLVNPSKKGVCSTYSKTANFYLDKLCVPLQEPAFTF